MARLALPRTRLQNVMPAMLRAGSGAGARTGMVLVRRYRHRAYANAIDLKTAMRRWLRGGRARSSDPGG